MNKFITVFLFCVLSAATTNAQKFGYVNSTALLFALPEVKSTDSKLQAYQNQLVSKGEEMVGKFEINYKAYLEKVNSGTLSQIQMQISEATLAKEQQAIKDYEIEVQNLLAQKKQELYKPLLDKVQNAIDEVGKEKGFTFIFESGTGGILFVEEAEDLMTLLKTKLGI